MEEVNSELLARMRQAKFIIAHPSQYWLCEGCESIVRQGAIFCPNCHGYHFNRDHLRVQQMAWEIGSRMSANEPIDYE